MMSVCLSTGGHPHNWNALSSECLSLLADLTQRLVAHHETVAINGRAKLHSAGSDKKSVSSEMTAPFTSDLDSPFSSPHSSTWWRGGAQRFGGGSKG